MAVIVIFFFFLHNFISSMLLSLLVVQLPDHTIKSNLEVNRNSVVYPCLPWARNMLKLHPNSIMTCPICHHSRAVKSASFEGGHKPKCSSCGWARLLLISYWSECWSWERLFHTVAKLLHAALFIITVNFNAPLVMAQNHAITFQVHQQGICFSTTIAQSIRIRCKFANFLSITIYFRI